MPIGMHGFIMLAAKCLAWKHVEFLVALAVLVVGARGITTCTALAVLVVGARGVTTCTLSAHFASHCGGEGFRMNSPPTWVHYAGSRGECLYRCMSQEKCLAANVLANLKDKMVCEMFDYINLKCDTDSTAASYKVKVNKGLSYLKKTML